MRCVALTTAVLAVLAASVSTAAETPVEQGSIELSGALSWATASYSYEDEDLGSETAMTLAPGVGYFIADGSEFRLMFSVSFVSIDPGSGGGSDYSMTRLGPQLAFLYHFGGSESFAPYVGAGVGASWASDSEDGEYETAMILPSIHFGVRSFFTESACLTTELLYQRQQNAAYIEDLSANVFSLNAGFSIFF
ncbi:MAG TPA: outer membrane beta-barrel protein [bacterium]|nr:outer membrane beta-barrel protein [bacterium]